MLNACARIRTTVFRTASALSIVLTFFLLGNISRAAAAENAPAPSTTQELAKEGASKLLKALGIMLKNIPQYELPEVLENGDILIRRIKTIKGEQLLKRSDTFGLLPDHNKESELTEDMRLKTLAAVLQQLGKSYLTGADVSAMRQAFVEADEYYKRTKWLNEDSGGGAIMFTPYDEPWGTSLGKSCTRIQMIINTPTGNRQPVGGSICTP